MCQLRSQQLAEKPPLRRCAHRVRRPPVGHALHICRVHDVCVAPHQANLYAIGTPRQMWGSPMATTPPHNRAVVVGAP